MVLYIGHSLNFLAHTVTSKNGAGSVFSMHYSECSLDCVLWLVLVSCGVFMIVIVLIMDIVFMIVLVLVVLMMLIVLVVLI